MTHPNAQRQSASRGWLVKVAIAGAAAFAITGCDRLGITPGRTFVVLVDRSSTVPAADTAIYLPSFQIVLQELRPADRLVLGRVGSRSAAAFRPEGDWVIPRTRIMVRDQSARDSVAAEAQSVFNAIMATPREGATDLLGALSGAADIFTREGARRSGRVLLLLSDMLQESPQVNFLRARLDSAFAAGLIAERAAANALPDLTGVRIYVAGASAPQQRPDLLYAVREVWLQYFAATGALSDESMYGRTALREIR